MIYRFVLILAFHIIILSNGCTQVKNPVLVNYNLIKTGADELISSSLELIKDKKTGVVSNQASVIHGVHLVDTLLTLQIEIVRIFSPEHGFRGESEAGKLIEDGIDIETELKVISLYGSHKKPTADDLKGIDIILFDLQDVGVRFYTYISTLTYVMEACAENGIPLIVLDRPNPNGFYVDGPVLDTDFSSFVGLHPVPIVYGMTIGEYAGMINGENWLKNNLQCDLTIIPLTAYHRNMIVKLPVTPSPNLPNWQAVYLYPSLCLFEGTIVSVGRGTGYPFQVFGHPDLPNGSFSFTPESMPGASLHPKFEGQVCYGQNLIGYARNFKFNAQQLNLSWLIGTYQMLSDSGNFFTNYFEKLAGTDELREQIKLGISEEKIREGWQEDLNNFKKIRAKYLIYD